MGTLSQNCKTVLISKHHRSGLVSFPVQFSWIVHRNETIYGPTSNLRLNVQAFNISKPIRIQK